MLQAARTNRRAARENMENPVPAFAGPRYDTALDNVVPSAEVEVPATPGIGTGGLTAEDVAMKECIRAAEQDAKYVRFFSKFPLTMVEASCFKNETLVGLTLYSTCQDILVVGDPRASKSAAMEYGILRDLEARRKVVLLTCQASSDAYEATVAAFRANAAMVGLPSTVRVFDFEDVRQASGIQEVMAHFADPLARCLLCLRMDTAHLNRLCRAGFKLPADTAVWLDEPQNKFTFKRVKPSEQEEPEDPEDVSEDQKKYVKAVVEDLVNLNVSAAVFRTVSATQVDTLYWLRKIREEGGVARDDYAGVVAILADEDKLRTRRFARIQDYHLHYALDDVMPGLTYNFNYGHSFVDSGEWGGVYTAIIEDVGRDSPSMFYGNYLLELGAY